jgi:hypothetical protein
MVWSAAAGVSRSLRFRWTAPSCAVWSSRPAHLRHEASERRGYRDLPEARTDGQQQAYMSDVTLMEVDRGIFRS